MGHFWYEKLGYFTNEEAMVSMDSSRRTGSQNMDEKAGSVKAKNKISDTVIWRILKLLWMSIHRIRAGSVVTEWSKYWH